MKVLPDTHILIWTLLDDARLSRKARDIMLAGESEVCFSTVSIWEIAIKHAAHPGHTEVSGRELARYCLDSGFSPLVLRIGHVHALETLTRSADAPPHSDPFDRILIAQAKAENMLFLTHDARLPHYNESCIVLV